MVLTGEVQERRDGVWRTVHLGHTVRVTDRRRVKPDGSYGWTRHQRQLWTDVASHFGAWQGARAEDAAGN